MIIKATRTVALELHPAIHHAMNVVDRVWWDVTGEEAICTGLQEEGHSARSLHTGILGDIRCRAFDIRISGLSEAEKSEIDDSLSVRLAAGLEYDVVWKFNHLHVEFQPH